MTKASTATAVVPKAAPSSQYLDALTAPSTADEVSDILQSARSDSSVRTADCTPRYGLCWLSMDGAHAFINMHGARTAPYRQKVGGKSTSRRYMCKSAPRDGTRDEGTCKAYILVQQVKMEQLLKGSFKKCAALRPHQTFTNIMRDAYNTPSPNNPTASPHTPPHMASALRAPHMASRLTTYTS